jgi:hypothetical protein
MEREPT